MERPPLCRSSSDGDQVPDVMEDLERCSADLRTFCGDNASDWSCGDDTDESGSHSAAEIASECLSLLESLSVTSEGEVDSETVSGPVAPPPPTETALLREISDLGSELEALMAALSSPQVDDESCCDAVSIPEVADRDEEDKSPSICTSPKMIELTKRLERRPSTQRMLVHTALRRHRPFPLSLKSPSPSIAKKNSGSNDNSNKSATHVLLTDATFWRQYQSKSFQHHLTRQSQARANQQREKEKETKAIEYRYRRVPKRCYPLAKNKHDANEPVSSNVNDVELPEGSSRPAKKSYATRCNTSAGGKGKQNHDGLLCGVYLHGKRRSRGMVYLTCTSLEQLKTRVTQKFSLAEPIVNLYREQIATDLNGTRERKFLHRVTRFNELREGDLLCATTNGYDDMAILCAWMKKRQQVIHNYKSPQKVPSKTAPPLPKAPKQAKKAEPAESLTYKAPPPPQVKLWDENGRLVSICQRLPIAE